MIHQVSRNSLKRQKEEIQSSGPRSLPVALIVALYEMTVRSSCITCGFIGMVMSIYKAHFFCIKLGGFWTLVVSPWWLWSCGGCCEWEENDHDDDDKDNDEDDNADKQLGSKKKYKK